MRHFAAKRRPPLSGADVTAKQDVRVTSSSDRGTLRHGSPSDGDEIASGWAGAAPAPPVRDKEREASSVAPPAPRDQGASMSADEVTESRGGRPGCDRNQGTSVSSVSVIARLRVNQ